MTARKKMPDLPCCLVFPPQEPQGEVSAPKIAQLFQQLSS
jgi:hypothetical protein